jgi:hypothetical protein
MEETDEVLLAKFRQDLQSYLGLTQPIEPLTKLKESHDDDPFHDVAIIMATVFLSVTGCSCVLSRSFPSIDGKLDDGSLSSAG